MDREEYELRKKELDEKITETTITQNKNPEQIEEDDIQRMIQMSEQLTTEEEKEKIIHEDEEKERNQILKSFGGESLSKVPELADFLASEEHLTLGTHAKIPVPLEVMGHPIKVYIRPLSRKELIECRNRAKAKGHTDIDYEAILMVCSKYDGTLYTEKELEILGYGHMQTIGEAIMIASGESPENTESAMKKHLMDEFLEKFTAKTSW